MLYKAIKYPFFGDYMVKWKNPLSEDERKEWRPITARSKSGAVIKGLVAACRSNTPKATIVLGHPMGKEAKGYFLKRGYTDLLRDNGFNVVIFDINGFGESTHGNFSYFEDIIAIGNVAKAEYNTLPLGYHGISLGGQWATIAFAQAQQPYNFAIVESAATTLDEFWFRFPVAYKTLKVLNILLPTFARRIRMIDRIKEVKDMASILFIYSVSDEWVPLEMGVRFNNNCSVASELYTVKDARHADIPRTAHKEEYFDKIISYFNAQVDVLAN